MATISDYERTISGCKYKIKEIEGIKNTINGLIPSVESCGESVNNFSTSASEIIINGKPLDQNKMTDVTNSLNTIKDNLNEIINECNEKIKEYENKISECEAQIASLRAQQQAPANANSTTRSLGGGGKDKPSETYLKD